MTRRTSPPSATRTSPLPSTPCSSSAASTTAPSSRSASFLNSIGDSLVIGEDDEAFKVHVHTDTPGVALTEAQRYGTLELAKIENMRTQAEDLAAGRKAQSTDDLEEDGHDHAAPRRSRRSSSPSASLPCARATASPPCSPTSARTAS
ncbi:MAG: hypothetical protein ACLR1M_03730 [Oscillospiraceae bacterium]